MVYNLYMNTLRSFSFRGNEYSHDDLISRDLAHVIFRYFFSFEISNPLDVSFRNNSLRFVKNTISYDLRLSRTTIIVLVLIYDIGIRSGYNNILYNQTLEDHFYSRPNNLLPELRDKTVRKPNDVHP